MKAIACLIIFLMAVAVVLVGIASLVATVGYILSGSPLALLSGLFFLILVVSLWHTSKLFFSLA